MTASTTTKVSPASMTRQLYRVEVWAKPGESDPEAALILPEAQARLGGVKSVRSARIFLIEAILSESQIARIAEELLTDPVNQIAVTGARSVPANASVLETHYLPGVMDPVAQSTREAIAEMILGLSLSQVRVRTGFRFDLEWEEGREKPASRTLSSFAETVLANSVIQEIHTNPFRPDRFPQGKPYELRIRHVRIRDLDDEGLERLSRQGHLFLSLQEMRQIRDFYRRADGGREPTDIELETLAQTWSEHCIHKTLKSTIVYKQVADPAVSPGPDDWLGRPNHELDSDGSLLITNLLESTIAAATHRLMESEPHRDWCVSVFEDNAGIVKFDEEDGVCIKVETHNHPSAIEPYGGAATGIGGCIRDILGTGLAARPVANTDTFCVAWDGKSKVESQKSKIAGERADSGGEAAESDFHISTSNVGPNLPKGVIDPKRILQQVVAGVRDYGNRMGIPTISGAVYFHDDYVGNPLVFAGCVGLLPLHHCFGDAQVGDRIIVLGGATGRDGIHGATFSSAELTDSHADEFNHAVQIGNPVTQKKMMDVILQARDHPDGCLFNAITDCGAGGFSSAVGEMGRKTGAMVTLQTAPLKYEGLSYTEIWISEAQERMVLAVPPENSVVLRELCEAEDVECCDLGQFGRYRDETGEDEPILILTYEGEEVGRLTMRFLHEGIPTPQHHAQWTPGRTGPQTQDDPGEPGGSAAPPQTSRQAGQILKSLLSHPNIASKHWIIRQYDHEVQGGSVVKPLVGPQQDGPSDAAVVRPKLSSERGIALSCSLQPHLSEKARSEDLAPDGDSYWATLVAIDEAVRNVVCVGADPDQIALLDNFCWPSCDDPNQLGALVRAAEACYDGALAYGAPFVSGKDSLNNQFTTEGGRVITIPPTLLITALGIVRDVTRCVTMDAKAAGNVLLVVGLTTPALGGSHYRMVSREPDHRSPIPKLDLRAAPITAKAVAALIRQGVVASAHDCSDGGLLVAAAEMAFAGRIGLELDLQGLPSDGELDLMTACFAETPSRFLIEVHPSRLETVIRHLRASTIPFGQIGTFVAEQHLTVRTPREGRVLRAPLDELLEAWIGPLDW